MITRLNLRRQFVIGRRGRGISYIVMSLIIGILYATLAGCYAPAHAAVSPHGQFLSQITGNVTFGSVQPLQKSAPPKELIIWVKAFIDRNVPGYTEEIASGPNKGKSILEVTLPPEPSR